MLAFPGTLSLPSDLLVRLWFEMAEAGVHRDLMRQIALKSGVLGAVADTRTMPAGLTS